MKRCTKCGAVRPDSEFYSKRSRGSVVLTSWCKDCTRADARERSSAYYTENREEILARNREPNRERMRARRAADPERSRELTRAWRARNPDRIRTANSASRKRNPSAVRNHGAWRPWWDKQDGLCVLCGLPLPADRSKAAMDHDHACCPGVMSCNYCRRGLVHGKCNKAIGMLGDDPDLLMTVAVNFARIHAETRQRIARKGHDALPFDEEAS